MTVDHLKRWLTRLALLGYNLVMLYTEDTYKIPGEPYFGYQRGAYSAAELKMLDQFAATLGIELVPCIQTLGHLEKILRHPAYAPVCDTPSVLLVGEPKTYELIEKMIRRWREVCRTRRIHIGMDETHDLGRGRYLDRNGYRPGFDLFNEHLARVVEICRRHQFEPMIWSDMYFRLGCQSGDYYDPATVIPASVIQRIPAEVELVYWDYYHADKAFYRDWIKRHRQMRKEPIMGSGIWTWNRYWYDHRWTEATAGACLDACRQENVREIIFTMWGDNGAFCDHDSAFAGLTWCADKAYGHARPNTRQLERRFAALCGGSYAAHWLAGNLHRGIAGFEPVMWGDPIFETHFRTFAKDSPATMARVARGFARLARQLEPHRRDRATGDLEHAYRVAHAFAERYRLSADLLAAYRQRDRRGLARVARRIASVDQTIGAMEQSFRAMWLRHNKPEGLETIQGRFGMLHARYAELAARLKEYAAGAIDRIAELDCACPPKG